MNFKEKVQSGKFLVTSEVGPPKGIDVQLIFSVLILGMMFLTVQSVDAVPAIPSPTCAIIANVLKIEKTSKVTTFKPVEKIEYYKVNLHILEISTDKQEGMRLCDNSYTKTAEENGEIILSSSEYDKNPIKEGQKIKAKIRFGGDERFGGIFLFDIQILESPLK